MFARYHGEPITPKAAEALPKTLALNGPSVGYIFADLAANPASRLPEGSATISALKAIGVAMANDPSNENSAIPAAYTYFGQFIDHDITKTELDPSVVGSDGGDILKEPDFSPLSADEVAKLVRNVRSPILDLDSLYEGLAGEAQTPDGRMVVGEVTPVTFGPIKTAEKTHDLPRRPMIPNPRPDELELDRQALIGDPRNDENLLVAQLHVGLLRSHNALMDKGSKGADARVAIRRRYQWAVLHDFLPRVCDRTTVDDVLANGPKFWKVADKKDLFMPLEFSAAAYRFGHSMIRQEYSHNATFNPQATRATFNLLFTFTALSGSISPGDGTNGLPQFPTLPDNWIIEWPRFFSPAGQPEQPGLNPARRIDTHLAPELGKLPDIVGREIEGLLGELAARNLLRGYLFALPCGQAIAAKLGVQPLARETIVAALPPDAAKEAEAAGLLERTPLWFYVLAEAGAPKPGPDGQHLGPVGSRIVAETLWTLVEHAPDSVIKVTPSAEELASGEFTLKGLIRLGQDQGMEPIPTDEAGM